MDWTVRRLEALAEAEARFDAAPTVSGALEVADSHLALAAARALMGRRDLAAASITAALEVLRNTHATWPRDADIARAFSDLLFRCAEDVRLALSAFERRRLQCENVALATRIAGTGIIPDDEAFDRLAGARSIVGRAGTRVLRCVAVSPAT